MTGGIALWTVAGLIDSQGGPLTKLALSALDADDTTPYNFEPGSRFTLAVY